MPSGARRPAKSRSLVSQSTPASSAWLVTACTTAATANGPITFGNEVESGIPTVPPIATKAWPARYADRAIMAVLNTRWVIDGPRRIPKMVQAPTSPAPTGPSKTAAARVAEELGDQASCRGRNKVAVDSKTTSSRPSTATFRHQRRSPNGPRMIKTAAMRTTAPIYSRAAHESLAKPSPLTARDVERGLCSNPLPPRAPGGGGQTDPARRHLTRSTRYSAARTHGADLPNVQLPTARRISSKVKDNVATTDLAGPNLIVSVIVTMGNQMWHMLRNCPTPGKSDGSRLLRELDRRPDFTDTDENFRAQVGGRRVAAAVLGHEPLNRLLEAVLAQAGAAFVQMLADLRAVHVAQLAVQIAVDPLQYLGTRRLMWLSAAHRASSPGREASEPVRANPRSDA